MSEPNGNGQPASPNTISPQAMAAIKAGMPGPAIDIAGPNGEYKHVIWPIPGVRDAIIIPFAQFKCMASLLLKFEGEKELNEIMEAQKSQRKIILPEISFRGIRLDR